jgi:riboflavin transporter FmnP
MRQISQKKLELAVAIGFSIVILVLSSTRVGYITIDGHRNLDMGIIPAIFAAMIGGYRVGIPVAVLWSFTAYYNPASNLQIYGLAGLMINRVVLVTAAYHAYQVCKKYYQYSPANVYRAIIAAVTAKNIVANAIFIYIMATGHRFHMMTWLKYTAEQ